MQKRLFLCTLLFIAQPVAAQYLYKVVTSQGQVLFTNKQSAAEEACTSQCNWVKRKIKDAPINVATRSYGYYGSYRSGRPSVNRAKFSELIEQAAYKHQVDPKLVHAVVQTESAYNPGAVSPKGAVGLMQLMPDTARRFGVLDSMDPDQNVEGGTRYLRYLLDLFGPNLDLAVAAYNAGENAVLKYNNSIPPYPETQNYVRQVLARYNR